MRLLALFLILFFSYSINTFSQTKPKSENYSMTRILFIFDASNSMNGYWNDGPKINAAKDIFISIIDSLKSIPNLEIALRVYGHQSSVTEKDCKDSRLEVGFAPNNSEKIKNRVRYIAARGTTPIAYSIMEGANDFPKCETCRNVIVLITDGIEECGQDPCGISKTLQAKGVILEPFVIGIGANTDLRSGLDCMGKYYDATNEEAFKNILNVVVTQALNATTAQVNLLDEKGIPTETDVAFTLYNSNSGAVKYNFIHTLNGKGQPDTLKLDHMTTYDLVVHTIPPVEKKDIVIYSGKHNIIGVDAPRGSLKFTVDGNNEYKDLKCIIKKSGDCKTINIQDFKRTEKYLIGKYDIEVLTLPRLKKNELNISQDQTTTVKIPQPGILSLKLPTSGYGSLFYNEGNELKWVCDLDNSEIQQQYILLPGKYTVVFRAKNSKQSIYTIEKSISIISGGSVLLQL